VHAHNVHNIAFNNGRHDMKHCTARTALKYGAASCGEEYTPGNGHVGF